MSRFFLSRCWQFYSHDPSKECNFAVDVLIATLLLTCAVASGQSTSGKTTSRLGVARIVGTVTFANSRLPAREALVEIVPSHNNKQLPNSAKGSAAEVRAHSDLNGNYSLEVRGGVEYIVLAGLPGYLSWRDNTQDPTLIHSGTTVVVQPNGWGKVDLTLSNGAALDGKISYDDGSLAIGLPVDLIQLDPAPSMFSRGVDPPQETLTDDSGHYRIFGLPPGQYKVATTLPDKSSAGENQESLMVYADGVTSERAGNILQLGEGEQRSGIDIVIPLSSLYTVSGVVSSPDGRAATSGFVVLQAPSNPSDSRHAALSNSGAFSFSYVPAGPYCLSASHVIYQDATTTGDQQGLSSLKPSCLQVQGDTTMLSLVTNSAR